MFITISSQDICIIYQTICDLNKPLNIGRVDSCYSSIDYYDTLEEKIASVVRSLIKNHYFPDGNKRTSLITFANLCDLNDLVYKNTNIADAIIDIASSDYEISEIIERLF